MTGPEPTSRPRGWARCVPAALVALAAAVVTAHGLAEVAIAAHVPDPLVWAYPLITDGLALVAYTATNRLATVAYGFSRRGEPAPELADLVGQLASAVEAHDRDWRQIGRAHV